MIRKTPPIVFADEAGQPLPEHIQIALRSMLPRLRREFSSLQDDAVIADVMETAGRKVAAAEVRHGQALGDGLYGYVWTTLRSVAVSRVRLAREAPNQDTREVTDKLDVADETRQSFGSPAAIERAILLREIFAMLSPAERRVAILKKAGLTSPEIAERRGTTPEAVDMMYSRVRSKIRTALQSGGQTSRRPVSVGDEDREE